jgi:hypothetical protein
MMPQPAKTSEEAANRGWNRFSSRVSRPEKLCQAGRFGTVGSVMALGNGTVNSVIVESSGLGQLVPSAIKWHHLAQTRST